MPEMSRKKKVVVLLPADAAQGNIAARYSWELEALGPIGAEIREVQARSDADVIRGAADADAIITPWGIRLGQEILGKLRRCIVIGVASIGVDMIDVEAATRAGIIVTNTPDIIIEDVADHTMALLLCTARRTKLMDQMAGNGQWHPARSVLAKLPRLWGQTLGLIAFGNVARAVARRAKPFGFHIIAYDPYVTELKMTGEGVEPVSLEALMERSDYVSIHTPLNRETYHMLSTREFKAMKSTAVLVNTGRGPAIDEDALISALNEGEIAAAGLDVLETEPPDRSNPLFDMPNVIITPHVASVTARKQPEARRRVGREVALTLTGRWPMSCVNPSAKPRVALERWQPYPMDRGPNR
jgi:D-3-phosphoglycerate dehydrogenase / 2-oxoglutarate reductase